VFVTARILALLRAARKSVPPSGLFGSTDITSGRELLNFAAILSNAESADLPTDATR
jgi:hypothetical protein